MSSITFFGSGSSDSTPARVDRERQRDEDADRLPLEASLRQRQTRKAATSTAATAAIISRADMTAEGTSARLGDERARASMPRPPRPRARSANRPKQVGPEPLTAAASAPAPRRASSLSCQVRAQRERGPLEVVLERGGQLGRPARGGELAQRLRVELLAPAPRAGRARRRRPPSRGPRRRGRAPPRTGGSPTGSTRSPAPCTSGVARLELAGHVGAEVGGQPEELLPRERLAAEAVGDAKRRRGVGAAAAEAGRDRDALVDRERQRREPAPGSRERKSASARAARLWPGTPAQSTLSSPPSSGSAVSSSARSIEANSEQSGCRPSSRGGPTCSTRLSLA